MLHELNTDQPDKIPKQKLRVTNWSEYNEDLRRRRDPTVWISKETLGLRSAPRRMTLGVVFHQPLRQTQGLMRSVSKLLGVGIATSDFSTLSRRGNGLNLPAKAMTKNAKASTLALVRRTYWT